MIDPDNLRTASLYINNQLLSRGLLRDGQNIDFADPEGSDGGLQIAMGRIIGVVNDLILRRDRDAEHRESLSTTLRTLRTDYQRQTTEFVRQTEKLSDTQRRVDTADATERALRAQLKTAEQGIHKLKDEMAKLKSVVAQTRSACANEVRKRDRHIDSLKKAVADAGRVRGGGRSRDVITINVTGECDNEGDAEMGMPAGATESEGYSLRMETNGFLTELAKGLSEENEGLLALVRRTVEGLREMSGLNRRSSLDDDQEQNSAVRDEFVTQMPQKSAEELAAELEAIVLHLRSILTNPSFVSIEEVNVRDEVIGRLRAGLETMEARWKDAVHMIDGWRRRMASSGKSVDMEDLQMGLRLSPVRVRDVAETADIEPMRLSCVQEEDEEEEEEVVDVVDQYHKPQEEEKPSPRRFPPRSPIESLRLVPAPQEEEVEELNEDDDDSDSESSIFQDDLDMDDDLDVEEEPNVQILQTSTNSDSIDSSPLPEPPQISPLKDSYSSGNRGAAYPPHHTSSPLYRKRPGDFSTIIEENTWDLAAEKETPTPTITTTTITNKPAVSPTPRSKKASPQNDDSLPSYTASYDSPLFGKSGGKPSQAQLSGKLFSKLPAEQQPQQQQQQKQQRPRSTAVGTSISQRDKVSPPSARTTRSGAKISVEAEPTSSAPTPTSTSTSTSTTATSTSTTGRQERQAAETTQRNAPSVNSSSSTSTSSSASSSISDPKQPRTRSPTRAQQPAAPPTPTPAVSCTQDPASSRLPRRNAAQQGQSQSPLNMATIAAKLAASEREADAARVRAKLRAVRRSRRISGKGAEVVETQAKTRTRTRTQRETQMENNGNDVVDSDTRAHQIPEDVDPIKRDIDIDTSTATGRKTPRRSLAWDDIDELAGDDVPVPIPDPHQQSPSRKPKQKRNTHTPRQGKRKGGEEERDDEQAGLKELNVRKKRTATTTTTTTITSTKKRSGREKVASRRRSTLSPWELQGLISGGVRDVASPAR
ncbi:Afadin and alpha-actinin-binding-domain-containing protein [Xylaria arbuscula]|nr:Afadin and alpha-actinin-binding-domain-containing protein [Xylaria arbuscula]